ncbi:MAG: hypothetical protein ABIN36_08860 [Ferruginibacter sp.]
MIFLQLSEQLKSLEELLLVLDDDQYNQKIDYLGNASIGGHSRHIIELLKCACNGYQYGVVDYFNRTRNLSIETDRSIAIHELCILKTKMVQADKQMGLITDCDEKSFGNIVNTTYFREIVYNTEHTIHHLALIKVALREMKLELAGGDFGLAYSTAKYHATNKSQDMHHA